MHVCGLSIPFPGAKRPLEEGQKLGWWDFALLSGDIMEIPPADVHILAAWHPAYKMLLGLKSKIGVLWTSSCGEMDFEPVEQNYLMGIGDDPRVSFIWFGDPALAAIYPEKGFYSPYPMDVDSFKAPHVEKRNIATMFCPMGPKKNILNQLLAMKLVQREMKLTLHVNFPVNVTGLAGYHIGDLDVEVHPWLPEAEYHQLLASARINLACSWAETFNYQAVEAALLGTLSVTSPTIPFPGIAVSDPNDPLLIASKILSYLRGDLEGEVDVDSIRDLLESRNREAKRILTEKLSLT